jgi:hypothetical protein
MRHDSTRTITRRAALGLFPWLCLAAAGPGCSPGGQAPTGPTRIPDRLNKMLTLRGTGDPRQQGKRPSLRARQKARRR